MKVGLVGTGGMGNVHARHYLTLPDVELVVWDRDARKTADFARQYRATTVGSYDELLRTVQAVDICLPTHLHADYVQKSLSARIPTLVEKPLARTVAEGKALAELAARNNTILTVGHVTRFFPEHRLAHQIAKAGEIGKLASVRMRRGGKAPVGSDEWFADQDKSGGVLLDLAIHDFDWLLWTLGKCVLVYARSVKLGSGAVGSSVAGDYALATLSFLDGTVAHVESTWMDPSGFRTTLEVNGSTGCIEFDSRNAPSLRTHKESGSRLESSMAPADDPYGQQLAAFVASASGGSPVAVTPLDALRALAVSEAAIESATTGKPVVPVYDF